MRQSGSKKQTIVNQDEIKLTKSELTKISKIISFHRKKRISQLAMVVFLFSILIASIANYISLGMIIGLISGVLLYECAMLRYDSLSELLDIMQKHSNCRVSRR